MAKGSGISQVRKNIDIAMNQAEQDRRKRLLLQRLELARNGMLAFQAQRVGEAVQNFQAYIRILEETKNIPVGRLMPTQFDLKKDVPELLMISGVYWDLTKLYDHTHSEDKYREFSHYLEKYIIFSKGMPFQAVCAETLRKYISNEKPMHLKEFKDAYAVLSISKCFVATELIDVISPNTLPILRDFRDFVMTRSRGGRLGIQIYYQLSCPVTFLLALAPQRVRKFCAKLLDQLAGFLKPQLVNSGPDSSRTEDKLTL